MWLYGMFELSVNFIFKNVNDHVRFWFDRGFQFFVCKAAQGCTKHLRHTSRGVDQRGTKQLNRFSVILRNSVGTV